ncbi:hypothetical protein [Clostridium tunisiense]|uniref:hypothetical protein n=1 Tax=Clostridium tunisiense TaxID=219748 RepID=UPI0002E242F8|nr:hypothetical protein [Clostridium tunisiense]
MSGYRILNCGSSMENYYICINEKVAGFTQRTADVGDTIFFSVKYNKKNLCGAKGILSELTDYKPWEDSDRYVQCFKVKNMEFCTPFDISILKEYGGKSWGPLYLQRSKLIKDSGAILRLENEFGNNKLLAPTYLEEAYQNIETLDLNYIESQEFVCTDEDEDELYKEEPLEIMGTFQTVKFKNETDKISGLEPLVTEHFYQLFQHFSQEKTILIPENRLFPTASLKNNRNELIIGIKSIPDALLISFDKDSIDAPLKINLIEYECYGESKCKTVQKFNYLNETIIPQLIRFASTFSIVTDNSIREKTIKTWIDKIMDYIDIDETLTKKVYSWMKTLKPGIKERQIDRELDKMLRAGFEANIRIILIIDELTIEQKETIKNVINSFKLDNKATKIKNNYIEFSAYIVRLEQKIDIFNKEASFALSFQE